MRLLVIFFAVGFLSSDVLARSLVDRLVAVVDGEPVLMSEVNTKVKTGPLVMISDFPATEKSSSFERALQDSINFKLMIATAEELEIEVTEDEIDGQIEKILKSQRASMAELKGFLRNQNKTFADFREDTRDQLLLRRFQGRVIMPLVKISEQQLQSYYLEKSGKTAETVSLDLQQLRIAASKSPEVIAAKRDIAMEAYERLKGGLSFDDAVRLYAGSEKPTLMSNVVVKNLNPEVKAAVKNLEEGQISEPVQLPGGFHLFQVVKRDRGSDSEYVKNKNQLEFELRAREISSQLNAWLASERQKRKIDIIE